MPTTGSEWFIQILIFVWSPIPIVGGMAFIVSSFYYHVFLEKRDLPRYLQHGEPFVTIFVPAHNEEASIASTVHYLERRAQLPGGQVRDHRHRRRVDGPDRRRSSPSCRHSPRTCAWSPS